MFGKMIHTWKYKLYFEKWVTFKKKNASHLEKCVTLRKMCLMWKNELRLQHGSHLEKWVTLGK